MRYVFHPDALAEYAEAVRYYAERNVTLAQSFIDAIEDAVYRLREAPQRYPMLEAGVRRCLVQRFPYAILYTVESEYILILAVMHGRRKPGYWQSRRRG